MFVSIPKGVGVLVFIPNGDSLFGCSTVFASCPRPENAYFFREFFYAIVRWGSLTLLYLYGSTLPRNTGNSLRDHWCSRALRIVEYNTFQCLLVFECSNFQTRKLSDYSSE